MTTRIPLPPLQSADFTSAFPNSRKVYIGQVPMREIALSGGEPPLRVYDTSGPQGHDPREGLPALRREWILSRGRCLRPLPPACARRFAATAPSRSCTSPAGAW
jgi:hypothetical protein